MPAAITCKQAYVPATSPSDWVYAFYLTCDDEIAVHFKHGQTVHRIPGAYPPGIYLGWGGVPAVCCLYPTTAGALGQKLFELATVWSYGGEFVHRFLYKKYAYQIVAPPKLPCAGCGILFRQSASAFLRNPGGSASLAFSQDVKAGSLLVVAVAAAGYAGAAPGVAIADSPGNTYAQANSYGTVSK